MKSCAYSAKKKAQIKHILVAFFIALFAAIDFIPNYGYEIYPFGYLFIFTMFCIISYTIVRHHLLDIEVIIKKTFIFGGLFTVIYTVFAFFAFLGQIFFEKFVMQNRWVSMIPSVLVVTIMLRPLENFLINVTDKYLFQKRYDYKKLLKTFTSEVLTVLELDKLVALTRDRLMEIIKIESCNVALGSTLQDAELKVPIVFRNQTMGTLLLGKKKSDKDYMQEDLDILQPIAKALGIAISNARLFDELTKTRAKMAEKDKMATIGMLAAGMAHEIRNPITTIRNFADYLPERYNDSEFISKFEKLIPREIDRVESIARSLLEFSSSETDREEEKFEVKDAIKTALSLLEPQYRSSEISLSSECREGCVIKANKAQMQDAMFNIMRYIFTESEKGSKIFISVAEEGGKIYISIRNRDLSVGEHIIKDVFEPVAGLYKEKRGFGFELFIAKELIERNNGAFIITFDQIKGSEFKIEFYKIMDPKLDLMK